MRSPIAILLMPFFLVSSLLPATEIDELSKVPVLLEHFRKHKQENPELTFLAFLKMHYDDPEHHQQDEQTHHKLPFSSHGNHQHALTAIAFTLPQPFSFNVITFTGETHTAKYEEHFISVFSNSIWQPPRAGFPSIC